MMRTHKTSNIEHRTSDTQQESFPVLLFDGVCNLCNASVQWVLLRDHKGKFKFAALQSEFGQKALEKHGLNQKDFDTVVLVDAAQIWLRSDVPLQIFKRLGGAWQLLFVFYLVPRFIRDAVYNWVARNRYRWFGRKDSCMLPKPEWKDRFIE